MIIKLIGVIISTISISVNIAYFLCTKFGDNSIYYLYEIFLVMRPLIIAMFTLYYIIVIWKKSGIEEKEYINRIKGDHVISGKDLHNYWECCDSFTYVMCYPFIMYTGVIRLINARFFQMSLRKSHMLEILA